MIRSVRDMDIEGKRVFIRCDFNVPLDDFLNITDDRRIKSAIPTIKYCLDRNCSVILASHLGRPGGVYDSKLSLSPVHKRLSRLLVPVVQFSEDVIGNDTMEKANNLQQGEILLLENLRFEKGETKNDFKFAEILANLADFYINDAFGVCHRAHASVEAITNFFNEEHSAAGFLLQKEINFSKNLLKNPSRPFVAVVGGSKVSGKLQALRSLLTKVDKLLIGGGMAFTFLKAQGIDIGNSLVEDDLIDEAIAVMAKARKLGVKLYLPVDVVAAQTCSQDSAMKFVTSQEIPKGWMGLDIGPATTRLFREALNDAQTILWNGPMGVFEIQKFSRGSTQISHTIAEAHATTVVGGGDTADVVARSGDADDMAFISTGGGASLELIEGKELPGVKPLYNKDID
ncbi:MAG: phosphoglycerate kinase [Epsilonproteobacteria bacterium]|nr:phosphoglycerate kinase [Campylobacterota bacterium]